MDKNQGNFSVIMSVYAGDKAEYLQESIDSICANTLLPSEIVLVVDGPVGDEIKTVIEKYERKSPLNLHSGGCYSFAESMVAASFFGREDNNTAAGESDGGCAGKA